MFSQIDKPLIMGILNVTPDSFSDGGMFNLPNAAVAHAQKMLDEGVDIIDVGGESTRPYAKPVSVTEQIKRVIAPIKAIREQLSATITISIDTSSSDVAAAAINVGADIINDVSAGLDPAMLPLAASYHTPIILMHIQGTPASMQEQPHYHNVVDEVLEFLLGRVEAAQQLGVKAENIAIDPGIGFGKRKRDNIALIAGLGRLVNSGYPILLGASRKQFMGNICAVSKPSDLVAATVASTALGVMAGVKIFRVHDVQENKHALDLAWAIKQNTHLKHIKQT